MTSFDRKVVIHHVQTDSDHGVRLAVHEWPPLELAGQTPSDAVVVFSHATGFHGRCWDQVVLRLPPTMRCLCVDQRGHGQSDKPLPSEDGEEYSWKRFGVDLLVLLQTLGVRGAVGVGHSAGGFAMAYAAAHSSGIFSSLLLLDPVILPPRFYTRATGKVPAPPMVSRRRDGFASEFQMLSKFRGRPPFDTWHPEVLRDYCRHGVVRAGGRQDPNWRWGGSGTKPGSGELNRDPPSAPERDHEDKSQTEAGRGSSDARACSASFVLACPPAVEAECYRGYLMCPLHARLRNVTVPVRVVRAPGCVVADGCQGVEDDTNFGFDQSPTDPHLYRAFGSAALDFVLHKPYTHFFPMMDPQMVADHVRDMIDGSAFPDTSLSAKL
mmetsp:Transcript_18714/g.35652  ORF Transcript_18714/g.35652 Transcript_18714/m.35652 type:complete len:381 (-) Transcript_18714:434-1576(-)|eukprot:CAMPEP_0114277230 /NCGR_PEP_ID=MMETSP0059-20121206/681_1 /TAXON_ID=36894 /ORGANISM="Pyramimonas parkeae, Strain CCMP726" /LENGTH=380 /DNA_ID=CAMNT_0001397325 /DNA_START=205 /DNA_END=1347 /DNA_ORIENTATION=+